MYLYESKITSRRSCVYTFTRDALDARESARGADIVCVVSSASGFSVVVGHHNKQRFLFSHASVLYSTGYVRYFSVLVAPMCLLKFLEKNPR